MTAKSAISSEPRIQGSNRGGDPDHCQNIENTGAHHIAGHQISFSFERSDSHRRNLRQRGSKGD